MELFVQVMKKNSIKNAFRQNHNDMMTQILRRNMRENGYFSYFYHSKITQPLYLRFRIKILDIGRSQPYLTPIVPEHTFMAFTFDTDYIITLNADHSYDQWRLKLSCVKTR